MPWSMSKLLCAILSTIMLWWWGWTNASPGNGLKRRTLLRMTENELTKINRDEQKILKTINGTFHQWEATYIKNTFVKNA
jgi:hypothetical protein